MERPTRHSSNLPACFLNQQSTGGGVPWAELLFPEPIEAPGGDVAQIESGRPVSPDRPRRCHEFLEKPHVPFEVVFEVVRKPRREKRVPDLRRVGHVELLAVQKGAATTLRRKELLVHGVVDDTRGPDTSVIG